MNYETEFINKAKTYVITTVSRNITMPAPWKPALRLLP